MTENRLRYETKGGHIDEAATYAQLLDYLRMAEECCYVIGHYRKAQDDKLTGQGWLAIGEMVKMMSTNITNLATKRLRTGAGFK